MIVRISSVFFLNFYYSILIVHKPSILGVV